MVNKAPASERQSLGANMEAVMGASIRVGEDPEALCDCAGSCWKRSLHFGERESLKEAE